MKNILTPLKYVCCIAGLLISYLSYSIDSKAIETQANLSIQGLYHRLQSFPNTSMPKRMEWFSTQFLGVPYVLGSLGEGPNARYDQFPRYRVDAFDCDTFVNTILALALGDSLSSFQRCMDRIRYHEGIPKYIERNHFTSIDWNQTNQKKGLLKDITLEITDKEKKPVAVFANTLIDKSAWYAHKTESSIRLIKEDPIEQKKRLHELKEKGRHFPSVYAKIPYIPLTKLFIEDKPNLYLFKQIPHGAIVEIIRPNWDLRQQIGTFLDISHLGFAFWIKGQLYFREASTIQAKVIDIPLAQYLLEARKSPTIKGINVQVVLPKEASSCKARKRLESAA